MDLRVERISVRNGSVQRTDQRDEQRLERPGESLDKMGVKYPTNTKQET